MLAQQFGHLGARGRLEPEGRVDERRVARHARAAVQQDADAAQAAVAGRRRDGPLAVLAWKVCVGAAVQEHARRRDAPAIHGVPERRAPGVVVHVDARASVDERARARGAPLRGRAERERRDRVVCHQVDQRPAGQQRVIMLMQQ